MYLTDLWASFLRRWYVALICLAVSAGILFLAAGVVKPTYEATASVVLIPPRSSEDPYLNRYMALGGLQESTDVLARSLTSEETNDALKKAVPEAEYEVVTDLSTRAPVLLVSTTSPDSDSADDMLAAVLDRIPANLKRLQDGLEIAASNQLTTVVLSSDEKPELVQKARLRVLAALAAGLVLASAAVVAALDSLLLRRAARKRGETQALEHQDRPPAPRRPEVAEADTKVADPERSELAANGTSRMSGQGAARREA
jgi:hypothetical protein